MNTYSEHSAIHPALRDALPPSIVWRLGGVERRDSVGIVRGFSPGNRYAFDFHLTEEDGWAQLDTRQDAAYYGHWANPGRRTIVAYVEGDVSVTVAETAEAFASELRRFVAWHDEQGGEPFRNGHTAAVDTMYNVDLDAAFIAAGLADVLHSDAA